MTGSRVQPIDEDVLERTAGRAPERIVELLSLFAIEAPRLFDQIAQEMDEARRRDRLRALGGLARRIGASGLAARASSSDEAENVDISELKAELDAVIAYIGSSPGRARR